MNVLERAPRSDSILRNLPEERQDEILGYCEAHTQKETLEWLATEDISISRAALSDWRGWYLARKAYKEREARIMAFMAAYKERDPSLTKRALAEMGEFLFNTLAIEREDVKTWSAAQQVQIKRDDCKLRGKKMRLELRRYKDQAARARDAVSNPTLTPKQREKRVKEILGIS
jgi:hypothetical protein